MTQGAHKPLAAQASNVAAGVPGLGRVVRKFSDLVSENILSPFDTGPAGEVKRILLGQKQYDDVLNSRVHQMTAELRSVRASATTRRARSSSRIRPRHGAGDVFENLDSFRDRLGPEDVGRIEQKRDVITDLNRRVREEWDEWKGKVDAKAPDAGEHFRPGQTSISRRARPICRAP